MPAPFIHIRSQCCISTKKGLGIFFSFSLPAFPPSPYSFLTKVTKQTPSFKNIYNFRVVTHPGQCTVTLYANLVHVLQQACQTHLVPQASLQARSELGTRPSMENQSSGTSHIAHAPCQPSPPPPSTCNASSTGSSPLTKPNCTLHGVHEVSPRPTG